MANIYHIQYPVGQGGLHLGIIDDYAYIYDCGGYGNKVNWSEIFNDISDKLTSLNITDLNIYISHLHKDYYNQVINLVKFIQNSVCCENKINWWHTGDAILKTINLKKIVIAFGHLLSNVNLTQIPHHCSRNNHDYIFANIFNNGCEFYYTTQEYINNSHGIVKPYVEDLCLIKFPTIYNVSDNPLTKIERREII